ncbi:hypothetical protein BGZ63DRAFT_421194 [Mariannaea sp. PMI_226]|nr:hypothetical protein BGZ63DRAFT_421194 [Mariannaea sp. PMI_226]
MMETATSFTSRRPAAGALPAFSLPPPTADVPSMAKYPLYPPLPGGIFHTSLDSAPVGFSSYSPPSYLPLPGSFPDTRRSPSPSVLTPSPGASDGLSPSLSSVNTGSSQGSQAPAGMQYSYGQVHGSWPTPGNSSYTVSSAAAPQPPLSHHFGRTSIFTSPVAGIQQPSPFRDPRSSQSPATGGEVLPPPPYGDIQQPFQTSISNSGSAGQTGPSGLSSTPISTQPPAPSTASAHVDSYTHTRPSAPSNYYTTSSTQQSSFPAYTTHSSASQHSPSTSGSLSRGLSSISPPQGSGMAPPLGYRYSYQSLPAMGASVLSNVHQPGAQMTMIPGVSVPGYGSHPMMYGGQHPPPQSERPFKCDQCVQSFSRNHDLKRHKRIHLAVKPFPCTFCSKSFSRKDALKRHRLVKGCEGKPREGANNTDNADARSNDGDESMEPKKEP